MNYDKYFRLNLLVQSVRETLDEITEELKKEMSSSSSLLSDSESNESGKNKNFESLKSSSCLSLCVDLGTENSIIRAIAEEQGSEKTLDSQTIENKSEVCGPKLSKANTTVGKVIKELTEPSVVIIDTRKSKKEILSAGIDAKRIWSRTPSDIELIRPLQDGVIRDFDLTIRMLQYLLKKMEYLIVQDLRKTIPLSNLFIAVPNEFTKTESASLKFLNKDKFLLRINGEIFFVKQAIAAGIGTGIISLEDNSKKSHGMIVDIGGGITQIAVIDRTDVVVSKTIRTGCNAMRKEIQDYITRKYNAQIGECSAEDILRKLNKTKPSSGVSGEQQIVEAKARDLDTGKLKTFSITISEVWSAIHCSVEQIAETVLSVIQETPKPIRDSLQTNGITLIGGGALFKGIDNFLSEKITFPVSVPTEPTKTIINGLNNIVKHRKTKEFCMD